MPPQPALSGPYRPPLSGYPLLYLFLCGPWRKLLCTYFLGMGNIGHLTQTAVLRCPWSGTAVALVGLKAVGSGSKPCSPCSQAGWTDRNRQTHLTRCPWWTVKGRGDDGGRKLERKGGIEGKRREDMKGWNQQKREASTIRMMKERRQSRRAEKQERRGRNEKIVQLTERWRRYENNEMRKQGMKRQERVKESREKREEK